MNISEFYPMYKAFYIWSNEVSVVNLHVVCMSICIYWTEEYTRLLFIYTKCQSIVSGKLSVIDLILFLNI